MVAAHAFYLNKSRVGFSTSTPLFCSESSFTEHRGLILILSYDKSALFLIKSFFDR